MAEIRVGPGLAIDEREIEESFARSSGPGGQNVNKTSTAVTLRYDVARSPSLPEDVRRRLLTIAAGQVTDDGVLVITAQEHRSQLRNRQAARDRLVDLVRRATQRPRTRRPTRPSRGAVERRLEEKRRRSTRKAERGWRE
jgi:ribosome-associated protein